MATTAKSKVTGKITRDFTLEVELKGAIRFRQDDEPNGERAAIGTIYLTKKVLAEELGGNFKRIRVTVELI